MVEKPEELFMIMIIIWMMYINKEEKNHPAISGFLRIGLLNLDFAQ